ncbi:hypothetical protein SAMN05660337_0024 [Maridesulfovibrio ferrireducens]|uniref:Uncharacterized protein n=1 Tax=Maridesulfovibrio ferrireducens TaxID=246191 RepID=A0A1G9AVG4_9BACT|nr:hypothetical protein [Maridesulfovibrio ferrireducens]SDK30575.1 hypothetical protein SAMN05660337_0024 [Maridesulfovibrio ferrireducens]
MKVTKSVSKKSIIGISGHAGAGHVHSHCGFVQDDSAGFAVATEILKKAFPARTTISSVSADLYSGEITVVTDGGGVGKATARRGFTPYEIELLDRGEGLDAVYSQTAAFKVFGRIYGQGILEAPVALQTACCLAVMDTFEKQFPGELVYGLEDMPNKNGGCFGACVEIEGIPVSVMALVNSSDGGVGPDEDLEGNIMLGDKGRAMKDLGLDVVPTIVLESKAYVPSLCQGIDHDRLWVRINKDSDNVYVYEALLKALEKTKFPYINSDTAYPRGTGELKDAVETLGERISQIGSNFSKTKTSAEKVALIAELALLVSQDAGGVTFMSSHMHDQVGGGGIMPGMCAVLSMTVSEAYIRKWKIPAFVPADSVKFLQVISEALPVLATNIHEATEQLNERFSFNKDDHEFLFGSKTVRS